MKKLFILFCLFFISQYGYTTTKNNITIVRQKPSNLFTVNQSISFPVQVKSTVAGSGKLSVKVVNHWKKTVIDRQISVNYKDGTTEFPLELSVLPPGYYELNLSGQLPDGKTATAKATLGVAHEVKRTAREARDGGYRFGLKMYRNPKMNFDSNEGLDSMCRLGLQWTREMLHQGGNPSTVDICTKYPMNLIFKVERFPKELFDTDTYGPLEKWIKENGRGWTLQTLPKEEPYKKWLAEILKTIPKDQLVFEIWNEAWDKMSAQDLAKISQWIAEVILADRPNAIIGPNLRGDTSKYGYDAEFIRAGGMKNMKMVALHPYGSSEKRQIMRAYIQWLKEQTGWDIDIYITEFGAHSTPEGPLKTTENQQAQQVVRQSLLLYAGGVKAMAPHWLGQREQNRRYHEHWFGFVRRNNELKPVLIAYANAARMIDGKNYLGDLWFGPEVEALVFEKDGKHTLVLFTRGKTREIELIPGTDKLTLTDMYGGESDIIVPADGKLKLQVDGNVIYLKDIGTSLASQASKELRDDRWPEDLSSAKIRLERKLTYVGKVPSFSGNMDEWRQMTEIAIMNPKVAGDDASGSAYLGWDEQYLYVGLDMRDNDMRNTKVLKYLYQEDCLELFISTEPRDQDPGHGPNDYQFFLTPTSATGKAVLGRVANRESGTIVPVPGAKFRGGKSKIGWTIEAAIPWNTFGSFKAIPSAKLAIDTLVSDADASHPRWKLPPADTGKVLTEDPTAWPLVTLDKQSASKE